MLRHWPLLLATLVLIWLGLHELDQDRRIAALRADLEKLRAAQGETSALPSAHDGAASERPPAAPAALKVPAIFAPPREPAPDQSAAESARPVAPAARVPVSQDEVARVESAVLSLLESDRPVLRERLRAVVKEQQETLEQQQQEQRRERWIARTEARLAELSNKAALTGAQREQILNILLANRDQIGDVMRSAETSDAYAAARETVRRLRTEADAKVRELLDARQYEAYRQTLGDDDERGPRWGGGEGRGRPAP